jgi:hypothetical protein
VLHQCRDSRRHRGGRRGLRRVKTFTVGQEFAFVYIHWRAFDATAANVNPHNVHDLSP